MRTGRRRRGSCPIGGCPGAGFPGLSGYAAGTRLRLAAVVKDTAGHVSVPRAATTVGASHGGGGAAIVHLHRDDGACTGWGLYLWGDAIAEGVGPTWGQAARADALRRLWGVFEIPLADPAAALNFIIHEPSGDSVHREPGGVRAFVAAVSPGVCIRSGDPWIHTARRWGAAG